MTPRRVDVEVFDAHSCVGALALHTALGSCSLFSLALGKCLYRAGTFCSSITPGGGADHQAAGGLGGAQKKLCCLYCGGPPQVKRSGCTAGSSSAKAQATCLWDVVEIVTSIALAYHRGLGLSSGPELRLCAECMQGQNQRWDFPKALPGKV